MCDATPTQSDFTEVSYRVLCDIQTFRGTDTYIVLHPFSMFRGKCRGAQQPAVEAHGKSREFFYFGIPWYSMVFGDLSWEATCSAVDMHIQKPVPKETHGNPWGSVEFHRSPGHFIP